MCIKDLEYETRKNMRNSLNMKIYVRYLKIICSNLFQR